MEEKNIINEIISTILQDRTDLDIQIAYSDDLYRDAIRVCENPEYLQYLEGLTEAQQAEFRQQAGTYVLPRALDARQSILISSGEQENGYSHLIAIAGEVLHAKNHTIFCETHCGGDFNKLAENQYYREFQIWDEFDARRTRHRLHLTLVMQQMAGYSMAEISNLLLEQELPERLQEVNVLLGQKNSVSLYMKIASILGMFHVWETGYAISVEPHMNRWIYDLYEALKKYDSIGAVSFSMLHDDIEQLWSQRLM